ncbi:MAG: tryptophan synthase subunit alpha, partial [Alphaproteobacteria bacterium]|nr:tryptophan synthase subunit alpha [Alphaproteobacteria bacterium]
IALVRLLTPTSDNQRIEKIVAHASGFLYYVSVLGITGSRHIDLAAVERAMARLRKKINLPIVVGFGITKKEEAAALKNMVDGVVVGSSIVRVIGDGVAVGTNKKTIVAMVQDKVKDIASGLA